MRGAGHGAAGRGGGFAPLYLYAAIAIGRLLWLEYRGPFGWSGERDAVLGGEHGHYMPLFGTGSSKRSLSNFMVIVYTWQNQFILWGGLLRFLWTDALLWALAVVALLNHLPWLIVVAKGFRRAGE